MLGRATIILLMLTCCASMAAAQDDGGVNEAIEPYSANDGSARQSINRDRETADNAATRAMRDHSADNTKSSAGPNALAPSRTSDRQTDKAGADNEAAEQDDDEAVLTYFDELADERAQADLPVAGAADDPPVEAGREALSEGWFGGYPWYDRASDALKPVRVQPRRQSSTWQPPKLNLPDWLSYVIWGGIAALLIWLAWILFRAWRNQQPLRLFGQKELTEEDQARLAAQLEALPFPVRRGTTNLLSEAARLYQQGNYREAIVYLFSYQLTELDKHHVLQLAKGKTNRQYVREVGRMGTPPRHTLRGLLEQTMVAFEDVFFGDYDLDRRRFETCWNRVDEFRSLLETGAGT